MPGIIVGVDGSDHSRRALAWAIQEAVHRHLPLTVMTVHTPPARPATDIYWGLHNYSENSFDAEASRVAVQEFVDKVANDTGETASEVTVSVATGGMAEELVKASRDADMLVVGSRGSGGSPDLRLEADLA